MKRKEDVYVVVDTPKKAKKLKRVLDMFGENVYWNRVYHNDGYPYYSFDYDREYWAGDSLRDSKDLGNKTKVSIKELRNILAKEHLKAGDVCLFEDDGGKYLGVFDSLSTCFDGQYRVSEYLINGVNNGCGIVKNFIRYATEEEKALLEPNKELDARKWYLIDCEGYYSPTARNAIVYDNGEDYSYGFNFEGEFINDFNLCHCRKDVVREATPQEVEQALIEEAKRRGHAYTEYDYNPIENELCGISKGRLESVFCDGHWEQPVDNFTYSDVAIVERLHDTLLDNHGYSLGSKLLTDARILANKLKNK